MIWIDIKERLPPNDCYVLVNVYDGRPNVCLSDVQIAMRINDKWFDDHNQDEIKSKYGRVTHWMVLPDVVTTITPAL